MASDPSVPVSNPVRLGDSKVLIGILAILEGAIWAGDLDEDITGRIAQRFTHEGLMAADYDQRDLRQAINDMNQRLRYAAGEYDSMPPSSPIPP